jgi:hypothetical protein
MHKTIITAVVSLGMLFASTAGATSWYQWPGDTNLHTSVISNIPLARHSGTQSYVAKAHAQLPAGITMQPTQVRHAYRSRNWGGYVDMSRGHNNSFKSVSSSFRVPIVNTLTTTDGPAGNMVSQWVGLDGTTASSSTVEQTGVAEWLDSAFGIPHYTAWWEMFPAPPVAFGDVNADDLMRANVSWYGPKVPSGFVLTLTDETAHLSGSKAVKFTNVTPLRNSSEVITELPSSANGPMALTDFGNVQYSKSGTTTSNVPHSLQSSGSFTVHRSILVDAEGDTMAAVGNLTDGGTAFNTPFVSTGGW